MFLFIHGRLVLRHNDIIGRILLLIFLPLIKKIIIFILWQPLKELLEVASQYDSNM